MRCLRMMESSSQVSAETPAGRPRPKIVEIVFGGPSDLEGALAADPEDLDQGGPLAVEPGRGVGVLEAVDDGGDIAERHRCSVGPGDNDDVLELGAVIPLTLGAQKDLAAAGLDRATREIERRHGDGVGHRLETEAVASERLLGDLDGDLVVADAGDLDLGDPLEGGELVPHPLGQRFEGLLGGLAVEHDGDHPAAGVDLGDHRLLGLDGEGLDAIHRRLDVIEDLAVVGILLELDGDGPDVFARGGADSS